MKIVFYFRSARLATEYISTLICEFSTKDGSKLLIKSHSLLLFFTVTTSLQSYKLLHLQVDLTRIIEKQFHMDPNADNNHLPAQFHTQRGSVILIWQLCSFLFCQSSLH